MFYFIYYSGFIAYDVHSPLSVPVGKPRKVVLPACHKLSIYVEENDKLYIREDKQKWKDNYYLC